MGAEPARIVAAPRTALGGSAPRRQAAEAVPLPPSPPSERREREGRGGGDRGPRRDFGARRDGGRGDRGDGGPRRDFGPSIEAPAERSEAPGGLPERREGRGEGPAGERLAGERIAGVPGMFFSVPVIATLRVIYIRAQRARQRGTEHVHVDEGAVQVGAGAEGGAQRFQLGADLQRGSRDRAVAGCIRLGAVPQ